MDETFENWFETTFRRMLKMAPDKALWELARKSEDVLEILSMAAITELGGRKRISERAKT